MLQYTCCMTPTHFLRILQSDVNKAPTRWRAAERLGISESMLSRVLNGKQAPSDTLLLHYGLKREVAYVAIHRNNGAVKE